MGLKSIGKFAAGGLAGGAMVKGLGKLFGGGGGGGPQIDPRVNQNIDLMNRAGSDSYAWNLAEAKRLQPTFQGLTNTAQGIVGSAAGRGDQIGQQYMTNFAPINAQVASDAMGFDSADQLEKAASEAASTTATAFGRERTRQRTNMARFGANPNNFASTDWKMGIEQARAEAGAANAARDARRMGGIQLRTGAANIGSGILRDATSQDALSLSGANTAGNLAGSGMDVYNRGVNSAMPWLQGANSAMMGVHDVNMRSYEADQARKGALMQGIGSLAGMAAGSFLGPMGAMAGQQLGASLFGNKAAPASSSPIG